MPALTHAQMVAVINGGGAVVYRGKEIATVAQLPSDNQIAADLASDAAAAAFGKPGGSDTQVQFNDANAFGGNSAFSFDKVTGHLALGIGSMVDPVNIFTIAETMTFVDAGDQYPVAAVNVGLTFNPSGDASGMSPITGQNLTVTVPAPNAQNIADMIGMSSNVNKLGSGHVGGIHAQDNNVFVGGGSVDTSIGFWTYASNVNGAGTTLTNGYGIYVTAPFVGGGATVANNFAFWAGDQAIGGANSYFLWSDSPGVFRVKADGVMAYYSPAFTKYTPGAANFERVVQQWSGNIAQYGPEAGGTGVLRKLQLLGASVILPVLPSADPHVVGELYTAAGVVKQSAG